MPKISDKGINMPASPIRRLVPYAEAAKARGRKVYHLNIGQPDIETPEASLNALKNLDEKVLAYSHSAGNASYRNKLSASYKKIGLDVEPEDIIVTTGGSEAITFSFMSTMNAGDEVIIPEPFYANYNGFAIIAGVVIKPITSYIDNNFGLPAIEEFEKLITPKTKGIAICNPNNPTGYLYSEKEIRRLAEIVKKHDLYLFADEVYREFCYDGNSH
ncbi:MAG: aminotransferase class I/II-fold pyridoxal phosphate-dependent enzyme, partial [Bacteroidales bacterium]|nr:aminotransferase class I/II-fold pyridoxal phosphate-dependent enzyme [Bacteroidales bacterium]